MTPSTNEHSRTTRHSRSIRMAQNSKRSSSRCSTRESSATSITSVKPRNSLGERLSGLHPILSPTKHSHCPSQDEQANNISRHTGRSDATERTSFRASLVARGLRILGAARSTKKTNMLSKVAPRTDVPIDPQQLRAIKDVSSHMADISGAFRGNSIDPSLSFRGAKVVSVDTPGAVPVDSNNLNRNDRPVARVHLQRNNAIRGRQPRKEDRAHESGEPGQRMIFEDTRDERRWEGRRRSRRSSSDSAVELSPLSSNHRSVPSFMKAMPHQEKPADILNWMQWAATSNSDPVGADVDFPRGDEIENVRQPLYQEKKRATGLHIDTDIDAITSARIARGPQHIVIVHHTTRTRSQSAFIECTTPTDA